MGEEQAFGDDWLGEQTTGDGSHHTRRRDFLRFAGIGASGTLLAGCLGGGDGDGDGAGDGDGGDGTTADSDGTATNGSQPDLPNPIKVGVMGPVDYAAGQSILNAAEMAVAEINDSGGILGSDVELFTKDNKFDPAVTKSVYQELILEDEVHFTLGPWDTPHVLAIFDNIAQRKKVHLSTGASGASVTETIHDNYENYKYVFRVGLNNTYFMGTNGVTFLDEMKDELGWSSVAIMAEDLQWNSLAQSLLAEELPKIGIDVPVNERVSLETNDFAPFFDNVVSEGVDAVYNLIAVIAAQPITQWDRSYKQEFEFTGFANPFHDPAIYDDLEGSLEGMVNQYLGGNVALSDKTKPFNERYRERFNIFPQYTGQNTFEAINIVASAIEQTGSLDSDELVAAIEGIEYHGILGTVSFYGKDDRFTHDTRHGEGGVTLPWMQWQDGEQVPIWPERLATGQYRKPDYA